MKIYDKLQLVLVGNNIGLKLRTQEKTVKIFFVEYRKKASSPLSYTLNLQDKTQKWLLEFL
jgi:hypothetical protein